MTARARRSLVYIGRRHSDGPLRVAAICGLLAPVSFIAGFVLADMVQPAAFSPMHEKAPTRWLPPRPVALRPARSDLAGVLLVCRARSVVGARRWVSRSPRGSRPVRGGHGHLPRRAVSARLPGRRRRLRQLRALSVLKIESGITATALLLTPFELAFASGGFRRATSRASDAVHDPRSVRSQRSGECLRAGRCHASWERARVPVARPRRLPLVSTLRRDTPRITDATQRSAEARIPAAPPYLSAPRKRCGQPHRSRERASFPAGGLSASVRPYPNLPQGARHDRSRSHLARSIGDQRQRPGC